MPSAGTPPARARIASQSPRQAAQEIAPVASRSSKYTRARDGRRFTSSPTSWICAKERSFARRAAAYSPTAYGPGRPLSGMPEPADGAVGGSVDTGPSIGATIDVDAAQRSQNGLLTP